MLAADHPVSLIASRYPQAFEVLLRDCTRLTILGDDAPPRDLNIRWATSSYRALGDAYAPECPILPELIMGERAEILRPRTAKTHAEQSFRTRLNAEVFTPVWVVNAQLDLVDHALFGRQDVFTFTSPDGDYRPTPAPISLFPPHLTWQGYVSLPRLEVTCGEAPYLTTRYDATTAADIPVSLRVGILDRKLRLVSENTASTTLWLKYAHAALRSVYGFEVQGDSLLLARLNLLLTFIEFFHAKFGTFPTRKSVRSAAHILSWNIFQMDGFTFHTPYFDNPDWCDGCIPVETRIRDWQAASHLSEAPILPFSSLQNF